MSSDLNIPVNDSEKVCIIGLGYVGLTLAVSMANVGYPVHGVEIRQDVLDKLEQGKPTFFEEGLKSELKTALKKKTLTFSTSIDKIPFKPSIYIITVGTPLKADGKVRLDMIENAAREIKTFLADGDLVILRSTVRIATARNVIMPILDEKNVKYQIAVCPERTLEGYALKELHYLPQIIGADDLPTRERCSVLFGRLTPTTIKVSSLETAELIKLVDNTYRDVIFSFGNEVARIADAIGVNAYEVINGGKLGYPRTNVALPGLVGGPCLEKDPHILAQSVLPYGIDLDVTLASRKVNERQPKEITAYLANIYKQKKLEKPRKIVLAGITFKGYPETDDVRGSMALKVFDALKEKFPDAEYFGYDPQLERATIENIGVKYIADIKSELSDKDLLVITNNHPGFRKMTLPAILENAKPSMLVYDFWNNFNPFDMEDYGDRCIVLGNHKLFSGSPKNQ
jgi:UDP-N-acetyl-D-mannosaminuronic acid dehydrogenase